MDKEKELGFEGPAQKEEYSTESASRARNRTVMLTPEMTSQVRSRFQQEAEGNQSPPSARSGTGFEPPRSGAGFETPMATSGYYTPGGSTRAQGELPAPSHSHPAPLTPSRSFDEGVTWMKESPVVAFLVSYDSNPNGAVFELRTGRLIVSNQPSNENTLLLKDPSVSSMHAIIRVAASGEIQVLDQLSEFGTKIKRFGSEEEENLSGEKSTVEHGDILSFGSRNFHVCVIPRGN